MEQKSHLDGNHQAVPLPVGQAEIRQKLHSARHSLIFHVARPLNRIAHASQEQTILRAAGSIRCGCSARFPALHNSHHSTFAAPSRELPQRRERSRFCYASAEGTVSSRSLDGRNFLRVVMRRVKPSTHCIPGLLDAREGLVLQTGQRNETDRRRLGASTPGTSMPVTSGAAS